jgi:hypothetical protein
MLRKELHLEELGEIPFDEKEILRYAMLPSFAPAPEELPLKECLEAAKGAARCRAVWRYYPLKADGEGLDLGFAKTDSRDLKNHLAGCGEILLFACTAGAEMDRRIARAKLQSPAKGLLMHAIGAQQVEGGCDRLCERLKERFPEKQLTDRFSPGYGDLPLEMQRDVMEALDCAGILGITLTDSLLMIPGKSVTGIIGMKERETK